MSFVSGCIGALDEGAGAELLSEQADRETIAKETRNNRMRFFMWRQYARPVPNVKWRSGFLPA
jgi:hypothetical protein